MKSICLNFIIVVGQHLLFCCHFFEVLLILLHFISSIAYIYILCMYILTCCILVDYCLYTCDVYWYVVLHVMNMYHSPNAITNVCQQSKAFFFRMFDFSEKLKGNNLSIFHIHVHICSNQLNYNVCECIVWMFVSCLLLCIMSKVM